MRERTVIRVGPSHFVVVTDLLVFGAGDGGFAFPLLFCAVAPENDADSTRQSRKRQTKPPDTLHAAAML